MPSLGEVGVSEKRGEEGDALAQVFRRSCALVGSARQSNGLEVLDYGPNLLALVDEAENRRLDPLDSYQPASRLISLRNESSWLSPAETSHSKTEWHQS